MNSLKQHRLNQLNRAIEVETDVPLSTDITLQFPYKGHFHRGVIGSWRDYGWITIINSSSTSSMITASLTNKGLTDVLYYRL